MKSTTTPWLCATSWLRSCKRSDGRSCFTARQARCGVGELVAIRHERETDAEPKITAGSVRATPVARHRHVHRWERASHCEETANRRTPLWVHWAWQSV